MEAVAFQAGGVYGFYDLGVGVAAADPAMNLEVGHGPRIEQRCIGGVCGDRLGVEVDRGQDSIGECLLDNLPALIRLKGKDRDILPGNYVGFQFDLIGREARDSGNQEGPTVEAPIADARQLGARLLSRGDNLLRLLDGEAGGIG